jgi:hypothetical protein
MEKYSFQVNTNYLLKDVQFRLLSTVSLNVSAAPIAKANRGKEKFSDPWSTQRCASVVAGRSKVKH